MKCLLLFSAVLMVAGTVLSSVARAENWTWFREPTQQGVSAATEQSTTWSATENVMWKTPIPGEAHSSPVVWENDVFLSTATNGGRSCRVLCLDAATGAVK